MTLDAQDLLQRMMTMTLSMDDERTALLAALNDEDVGALEQWARDELANTVRPLRDSVDEEICRRHEALTWLVAECAARLGEREELIELLFERWRVDKKDVARLVELLIEDKREDLAAVVARNGLHEERSDARARERLRCALETISKVPDGWRASLGQFARAPSVEAWRELHKFTPEDTYYMRAREALRVLMEMNVDGNILFECATCMGTVPDAYTLVEEGRVDVDVILARAQRAPRLSYSLWLGTAARAAQAKGDRFLAVRLLKDAFANSHRDFPPLGEALMVWDAADEEMRAMLTAAGIGKDSLRSA